MKAEQEKDLHDICRRLIADIQGLQSRAMGAGLIKTGHAINEAMNTLGWEYDDELKRLRTQRKKAAKVQEPRHD